MDTPALRRLMGAYFNQDWDLEYADSQTTVSAFLRDSPHLAPALVAEINEVLRLDEGQVADLLENLGCDVAPSPTSDGSYRVWLTELAAYARH